MKTKFYILSFIAVLISLASCKTASKLYQKGDYDEAVELAAKKLQKDPDDKKLIDVIQTSYRYASADHESRIRNNSLDKNELKWEWMYNEYAALQRMYEAIRKVPSVNNIIHPVDYSSYLITYGNKAGDVRYDRGLAFMQRYDKQSYRSAYREFQVAQRLKPGNRDIIQKMNEAYDYAVTNIILLPMEQQYGYRYSSYNNYQSPDEQLLKNLRFHSGNEFVKFHSEWEARANNIRADQVVDMRLATLNIGRYFDYSTTRQVSKEVVIKEIVYRPDSVVKVYGKVYATITTTRRTMRSDAMLQINARDGNSRWLWNENVHANHNWETEFAGFTGDERALSESDKQLLNRRQEPPPREEEIIRCLMDEINTNAVYRIKNYFSRY
ncbi:MAG TPA: hypothetical protein VN451_11915 [Chitinophagaceae bacterium]|nr:hypothetical protein [Chitinophagaceae bacterium]